MAELDLEAIRTRAQRFVEYVVVNDDKGLRAGWILAVRDVPELLAEVERLRELTVTCSCGTSPMTYEGPEPDCAVHGAVRALNEASAEVERLRAELKAIKGNRLVSAVFGHHKGAPRPFALFRRPATTISCGVDLVALGAEFLDGAVALRLADDGGWTMRSDGGADALAGDSDTDIVWLSDELEPLAETEQKLEAALAEVERLHRGECVCTWAPEGEEGESAYLAETRPFCPQHGESARARERFEWWERAYNWLARAVGVDPAEPFPEVDVVAEVEARLAALAEARSEVERLRDATPHGGMAGQWDFIGKELDGDVEVVVFYLATCQECGPPPLPQPFNLRGARLDWVRKHRATGHEVKLSTEIRVYE
jgi:hypothetical protein